jgi:hypothetical protein
MPKFTQTWGPVLAPAPGKRVRALSHEMEILRTFAGYLSGQILFYQRFHPSLGNWLPFYWAGFKQSARCTYVLDDLHAVWDGMAPNIRTKIRKAEKSGITVGPCTIGDVFETAVKVFARQNSKASFAREHLERLDIAAREHHAGACFAARDGQGRTHAATFIVWDRKRCYYLAGGADPELRQSGAQSLLVWHSIQFGAERSEVFDFEGSMLEPVEQFFRAFGAKQVPYHQILKVPPALRVVLDWSGKLP